MAAQEQALNTRTKEAHSYQTGPKVPDAHYPPQTAKLYTERHEEVAALVNRNMSTEYLRKYHKY